MAGLSNYTEAKLLNWMLNATTMGTAPAGVYVALFNGDPTDAGSGGADVTLTIRPAGRVAASFDTAAAAEAGAASVANDAVVDFGVSAGAASVTHFALYDSAAAGNMLVAGTITAAPKNIIAGANVTFPVGSITVSVD